MDEIARLAPGSHLSVHDRNGVKYKGILPEAAMMQPDSTQVLVIETAPDAKRYSFRISHELARNEVTKVSMPRKPTAGNVLTGGVLGMIGGAVAGPYVGEALAPKDDETLPYRVLGGVCGAIVGFATGAIVVEAATGDLILIAAVSGADSISLEQK
jgi:hypothetical protein